MKRRLPVCAASALDVGQIVGVCDGARKFAVYNVDGKFFATDDECTHGKSSLSEEGMIEGCNVVCGWHGGKFEIASGAVVSFPAMTPLRTYPVHETEGSLFIEVDEEP